MIKEYDVKSRYMASDDKKTIVYIPGSSLTNGYSVNELSS